MARWRHLVLLATLVVAVAGCRVDVNVGINAKADGSGQVRVEVVADREVAQAVDLSAGVRVDDLKQAGWTIDGPSPRPDGGVRVVATKAFADAGGARSAVEELTGPIGPFQAFRLQRSRSFVRTTTRFSATVDLARGIEAFGDPGVKATLGGSDIGLDLPQLGQDLKGPTDAAVGVQVAVRLPGKASSNAPRVTADGATWQVGLKDRLELTAQSTAWNVANLVGVVVAALLATLAVAAFLLNRSRRSDRGARRARA